MKGIRILSIVLAIFCALAAWYQFNKSKTVIRQVRIETGSTDLPSISPEIARSGKSIGQSAKTLSREIGALSARNTLDDAQRKKLNKELTALKVEAEKLEKAQAQLPPAGETAFSDSQIALIGKLCFSLLFGLSALFVILSKKYKEDTEKWAFSILSLISGVWIGTIS
jgi:hypothetical protein